MNQPESISADEKPCSQDANDGVEQAGTITPIGSQKTFRFRLFRTIILSLIVGTGVGVLIAGLFLPEPQRENLLDRLGLGGNGLNVGIPQQPSGQPASALYYNRGLVLLSQSRFEEARASFDQAIEINPANAATYVGRAEAQFMLNNLDAALSDFNHAIKLDRYLTVAYQGRGRVLGQQMKLDEALMEFNMSLSLDPNLVESYVYRAATYFQLGNYDDAYSDFEEAINLRPDYFFAYFVRAELYVKENKLDNAVDDLKAVIKYQADYAEAYAKLGTIYDMQRRIEDALTNYRQYLLLTGSNARPEIRERVQYLEDMAKLHLPGSTFTDIR